MAPTMDPSHKFEESFETDPIAALASNSAAMRPTSIPGFQRMDSATLGELFEIARRAGLARQSGSVAALSSTGDRSTLDSSGVTFPNFFPSSTDP